MAFSTKEQLIIEVLVARHRLDNKTWLFPAKGLHGAVSSLEESGLVEVVSLSDVQYTLALTSLGVDEFITTSIWDEPKEEKVRTFDHLLFEGMPLRSFPTIQDARAAAVTFAENSGKHATVLQVETTDFVPVWAVIHRPVLLTTLEDAQKELYDGE